MTGCGPKIGPYDCCTVVCGDCLELMKALPDGCIDAVITDPPYGIEWNDTGYFSSSRIFGQGVCDWDKRPSDEVLRNVISKAKESIIWGGNYFGLGPFVAPLVWDKQNGSNRFADGEIAWTSFKSGTVRIFRHQWWGFLKETERGQASVHPTQKPVALMEWCMALLPQAETILDPFLGSGTTAVAAKKLGRHFLGFEISPEYCKIAEERIALVEAQPTLFEKKLEQPELSLG